MSSDQYVTLLSNACVEQFPDNSPRRFRNKLCNPMCLEGDWTVALEDLCFPFKCYNITDKISITFRAPCICTPNSHTERIDDAEEFHSPSHSGQSSPIQTIQSAAFDISSTKIVARVGTLERGYYRNADELGSAICSLYEDLLKDKSESGELVLALDYDYSEVENTFRFIAKPLTNTASVADFSITIGASDWTQLTNQLGLERHISSNILKIVVYPEMTPTRCNVQRHRRLYACSDVIEYQQVGGTAKQLLGTVNIDQSGNCDNRPTPRFLQVRGTTIESIEIELMSNIQTGELFLIPDVRTKYNSVECTLHFRRKSMLQACI